MKIIFLLFLHFQMNCSFASINEKLTEFTTHDNHKIRGKLSYPINLSSKVPGVLLIHGSGSLDMNLYISEDSTANGKPYKMFEDIAHHLSNTGNIVFRYNKRGVTDNIQGPPSIDIDLRKTADVNNLIEDIKSALNVLKSDPNVDTTKIFLLGISEGTVLAPIVALEDKQIKGIVLLSSVARNLREILYFQMVERSVSLVQNTIDSNHDGFVIQSEIDRYPEVKLPIGLLDKNKDEKISIPELKSFLLQNYYSELHKNLSGPYSKWFEQHFALQENFKLVPQFKSSILLLHGESDVQTPIEEAYMIEDQLIKSEHKNYKLQTFKGLGHGFSPNIGTNGIIPTIGPIDKSVLWVISSWIHNETKNQIENK